MLCQTASYCNAKLVEATIPFSVANRVAHTLRFGIGQGCIPCRSVRDLLDDALSVFGKAPVIETEDVNRGAGFGSIPDCLNLTIKLESKDLFASRLKWRYEFGAVVIPPIILYPCAIARLSFHIVSWKTRYEIDVVQVRSKQVAAAATLWLDMLYMR